MLLRSSEDSLTGEMDGEVNSMRYDAKALQSMANKLRRHSVLMTTESASGHPTTCLSCADIMSVLFFDELRFDPADPAALDVDHFVLSKGHAAPILWASLFEAGAAEIKDLDLLSLRKFGSPLEGHPTPNSAWVSIATGSLGQGLSAAAGMAAAKKLDGNPSRIYALLGDGECAEGSIWEAAQFAAHEALDNLCAIVDVNALGQSGRTMFGHDVDNFARKFEAFGWNAITVDGHDIDQLLTAFSDARGLENGPTAIIARTLKGKGISAVENKDGWHGKPIPPDMVAAALEDIGADDVVLEVSARRYDFKSNTEVGDYGVRPNYELGEMVATRSAYGNALVSLGAGRTDMVAIDGDTKNSTYSEKFKNAYPDRFFEGYIAEQNMIGAALGLGAQGKVPFASSFAAFLSRGYDFIRMAAISRPDHLIICGSHAGVSIGGDGPSQMALEDLAMMRAVLGSTVLYPSDAVSGEKLVEGAVREGGLVYIRTTRPKTAVIYQNSEEFPVGGSKVVRSSESDALTIVAAGITLHNALEAHDLLASEGIKVRIVDLYSVKPIDQAGLKQAVLDTGTILTVEDHNVHGGLGDAVAAALGGEGRIVQVGIDGIPRSGTPEELMEHFGISAAAIAKKVRELL